MRLRLPSSTVTLCVVKTATVGELAAYIQHVHIPTNEAVELLAGNPPASIMNKVGFGDGVRE